MTPLEARAHDARVQAVVERVRAMRRADGFVSLDKGSISHFVPDPFDPRHRDRKLDVRDLDHILEIDVDARTCTAEPGVTFAALVREALPLGLVPALVPELEGITLGGAVAGCAVESMAHRHGGFHDSCLEYELVTGTGEILTCSRDAHPDVFEMMHGSYGTLGVLTKLTFRLVPAKPFVRIEYERHASFDAFQRRLASCAGAPNVDFVDAIAHGPTEFVLCLGRFVDRAPYASDYRGEHIYYLSTRARAEDYLTTDDYLFRFDADCHWATGVIPGMRSRLGRRLLGGLFLGSTRLLTWSRWLRPLERLRSHLGDARPPVVTDVFIPESRVAEFHAWYDETVGHYPLWIVPYRMPAPYRWIAREHAAKSDDALFVDFAIYGLPNDRPGVDLESRIEAKTFELGGIKTLIGQNRYDEAPSSRSTIVLATRR